jgi:hypothetical protein
MADKDFFGDPADKRFQVFRTQVWADGSTTDVAMVAFMDDENAARTALHSTMAQCKTHNAAFPFLTHSARVQRNFK